MFGGLLYKHMNSALLTSLCARAVEPHLCDLSRAATCCVLAFAELLEEIRLAPSTAFETQLPMHDWAVSDPFYSQERDRNLQRHIDLCLLVCIAYKNKSRLNNSNLEFRSLTPTLWFLNLLEPLSPDGCFLLKLCITGLLFCQLFRKMCMWARWLKVALMCGDLSRPSPVCFGFFFQFLWHGKAEEREAGWISYS